MKYQDARSFLSPTSWYIGPSCKRSFIIEYWISWNWVYQCNSIILDVICNSKILHGSQKILRCKIIMLIIFTIKIRMNVVSYLIGLYITYFYDKCKFYMLSMMEKFFYNLTNAVHWMKNIHYFHCRYVQFYNLLLHSKMKYLTVKNSKWHAT